MTQQLILDLLPAPPPTIQNFVVGKNQAALDALRQCGPGRAVYLWGAAGVGRTHLLRAASAAPSSLYFGAADSADTLRDLATSTDPGLNLIAVDDVELLGEDSQAALFALYNRWRQEASAKCGFALLLAGDRSARAMPLREDLRTRLGWDLVFRLEPLSDDDRTQALMNRARARGLALSPEIVGWLLRHYARDMNQLGALVDALDRYSIEKHRAITLPLLKEMLATAQTPINST